ncbi:MAG: hypothetical protein KGI58_03385, partial [Patescibacteria group bacterium]|nr:hypothetical protein [Patescibacteria group bacterium]
GKLVLCNTPGSVTVSPNYNQLLAVSGISGFTQSPSPASGNVYGTHNAFTGVISVNITGSSIAPGSQLGLSVNGTLISCKNVTGPMSTSFPSRSYTLTDAISVNSLSPGSYSTCN